VGLEVDPMQVRLLPEPQDGYAWSACPERQHLFLRPLSKHSVSAYRELDKEVGKSFEAIKPPLKVRMSAIEPIFVVVKAWSSLLHSKIILTRDSLPKFFDCKSRMRS
jgi:hypothetical protein